MTFSPSSPEQPELTALIELYEYKVEDLQAGREPRGGQRGLRDLRRHLLNLTLPAHLLRRLAQADRLYRQQQGTQPRLATAVTSGWPAPSSGNEDEAQAWQELQLQVWHSDLMSEMHAVTQSLRQETDLTTLRVLYAVTENAERVERRIAAPFAVPPAGDPLVSLHNSEVVRQLTSTLGDMLLLPAGRQRVWQAIDRVHADPFPRQANEEAMRARLSDLEQSRWADEREQHAQALRAQLEAQTGLNRDPQERPRLRAAARQIQQWLAQRLGQVPELLPGAPPQSAILYAQEPQSALTTPPEHSELLCIHLGSPKRLVTWQGLKLSWRSLGPNWQLLVQDQAGLDTERRAAEQVTEEAAGESGGDAATAGKKATGQVALLRPELPLSERHVQLKVGGHQLQVFFCGDYVLLRHRADAERQKRLAQLAAQGRALALLLDPAEDYGYLRLARALAQRLRGGPMHSTSAQTRYTALSPAERLQSARRSLQSLVTLLAEAQPGTVEQAARTAQHALHLPPSSVARLYQAAYHAAFTPETFSELPSDQGPERTPLNPNGIFMRFRIGNKPLEFRLPGDRLLSLKRDYRGELVLLLPGYPASAAGDLQVLALHDLTVVMVAEGSEVALCALPA